MESILKEEYDKSFEYFAVENYYNNNISTDSVKCILSSFRQHIVNNLGTELDYLLLKSEKRKSTVVSENTPPGTTEVSVQISNNEYFGMFRVLFDDNTNKIIKIDLLNIKEPIPSMTFYWLLGLIAICILLFNIYAIFKINRSSLKYKWIKYIAVFLLNIPSITYSVVDGFSFKLLNFQLFGVGFSSLGYMGSYWIFGIPLGGIFWIWRLWVRDKLKKEGIDLDSEE